MKKRVLRSSVSCFKKIHLQKRIKLLYNIFFCAIFFLAKRSFLFYEVLQWGGAHLADDKGWNMRKWCSMLLVNVPCLLKDAKTARVKPGQNETVENQFHNWWVHSEGFRQKIKLCSHHYGSFPSRTINSKPEHSDVILISESDSKFYFSCKITRFFYSLMGQLRGCQKCARGALDIGTTHKFTTDY